MAAQVDYVVRPAFHFGDDPGISAEITGAVERIAEKYPEVRGTEIDATLIDSHVYAYANGDGHRIVFNELFVTSPDVFRSYVADDNDEGFHPAMGHCSGPELLAIHESAHIIDFARGSVADKTLAAKYGGGHQLVGKLSGYSFKNGKLNPIEAIAEAFAAVQCNGGNPYERELNAMLVGGQ